VLLLEIAAQGVKGVSPPGGTVRLRPGYNVLPVDGAALLRLLQALFHPFEGDGEALCAAGAGGPVRLGATLAGDDGVTYRIVRDFARGAQLHRLDPQRRAFAPVSAAPEEVAALLSGAAGVPSRARLAHLSLAVADLPSRRAVAAAPPGAARARRVLSAPEAQKRGAELRAELDRSRRAEKLQYQADAAQSQLFRAEATLAEAARLRAAAEATEAAIAEAAPLAAAMERLGDLDASLAAHAKAAAKRDDALGRVAVERAAAADRDAAPPVPFWRAPPFWAGAGGGLAAACAGFAGAGAGRGLRYLALLDIPAFGWAAWVALRWVAAFEGQGRAERRSRMLEEHERKAEEAFGRETAGLREAMALMGVVGIPELREAAGRLGGAATAAREARGRLAAFEEGVEAGAEKADAELALREAEAALAAEAGGYVRDARSVEMEIQRVAAEAAAPPAPAATGAPDDGLRDLLDGAALELGGGAAAAGAALQARASQLAQALSSNRVGGLAVDPWGCVSATQEGHAVPVAALPALDRDVAFLALKLALLERALGAGTSVAVAEDVFAGLPEAARKMAARLLRQGIRAGQLLHATADPAFRDAAEQH
jgi:hypothetical protein